MPPPPLSDKPMTNAERQARYRLARAAARPVIVRLPAHSVMEVEVLPRYAYSSL